MAQAIIDDLGPKMYPNTLGEVIRLYTDLAKIDWKDKYICEGYEMDGDGEIVMKLVTPSGEKFKHNRKNLVRFEIIRKEDGNS